MKQSDLCWSIFYTEVPMVFSLMGLLPSLWAQTIDPELMKVQYTAPDPVVATMLSSTVGLGSGHFYSGNSGAGSVFFGSQALGAGLIIIGALSRSNDPQSSGGMVGAGWAVWGLSRVVDSWTAPYAARRAMLSEIEKYSLSRSGVGEPSRGILPTPEPQFVPEVEGPSGVEQGASDEALELLREFYLLAGREVDESDPMWEIEALLVEKQIREGTSPERLTELVREQISRVGGGRLVLSYLEAVDRRER